MKKICVKCKQEVVESDIVTISVKLKNGPELEPEIFEHKDCGGEVKKVEKKECPKCGSDNILETRSWAGEGGHEPYKPYKLEKKYLHYLCNNCKYWFFAK